MRKKKLAIIGGSYLQLPVVRKAMEMGIEVHCFSWRDGAVCAEVADYFYDISIVKKEAILEECEKIRIDGIITIASDVAVTTVNYVSSHMGLISNSYYFSDTTTNKYKMRQCFLKHGVSSPRFMSSDEWEQNLSIDSFSFPLIVKPTDRSGSLGVEKVVEPARLADAIKRAQNASFEKKAIIEEFFEGREVSVESISYKGKHFILQITDKITTGNPYFVELEHHQPSSLPDNVQNEIRKIVLCALDALHIQYGASHSELKISENGEICIMEIGARMGGDFIGSDLVYLSTGYDFLKGVIEIALGYFQTPVITEHNYSGVYFLSEETKYLKPIIEKWESYPEIIEAQITDSHLRHVECSGERCGYLIYKSNKKWQLK